MKRVLRRIDCLRISVTDRCNLRCSYCMPREGIVLHPRGALLSFEEILRLLRVFVDLGIKRIRLTGGEPLVRKGIVDLIKHLKGIDAIEEIGMTTNGILLSHYAEELKRVGVKSINISLDTLKEERFRLITGRDCLHRVVKGINRLKELGFRSIKLNVVVMKQINDDEIIDFVNFSQNKGLILRFIEFMKVTPLWRESLFIPIEKVKKICDDEFELERMGYKAGSGPAEYYQSKKGIIGFIKTEDKNCRSCSRLRLTSTGELKLCLYQQQGYSLRNLLRKGADDKYLKKAIANLIILKEDVDYTRRDRPSIYMCSVGG